MMAGELVRWLQAELVHWLQAFVALSEDMSLIPRAHVAVHIHRNFSLRASDATLFWLPQVPAMKNMYTNNIIK